MDNPTIIVALITSIVSFLTALFVAIFSYLNTKSNNKQMLINNKELEKHRITIDKEKANQIINDKHISSRIDSLVIFITVIQKIKDNMTILVNSRERKLDSETAVKMIVNLRQEFFDLYEQKCGFLDKIEDSYIHKAKNMTFEIELALISFLKETEFASLSEEQKKELLEKRSLLTEYQSMIRDLKDNELHKNL